MTITEPSKAGSKGRIEIGKKKKKNLNYHKTVEDVVVMQELSSSKCF